MVRTAERQDIAEMHRVRMSVLENRLTSMGLTDADYLAAMKSGGAWVIDLEVQIAGFAIGDPANGNIWALFIDPRHEGRGYGRRLHDVMVTWLRSQGCGTLWLTTEPETRAERFYESAGWTRTGVTPSGEVRFELPS